MLLDGVHGQAFTDRCGGMGHSGYGREKIQRFEKDIVMVPIWPGTELVARSGRHGMREKAA